MSNLTDILSQLLANHSSHTAKEITGQPKLWRETYDFILGEKAAIASFLSRVFEGKDLQIILTGAGTSAFIGEILLQSFNRNTGFDTKMIPTTDLVTHPKCFFNSAIPTLMVSFARSGDSPESVGAFDLAEKICNQVFHLVITCNANGRLAYVARQKKSYIFLMPEKANDQALAMTGSFTSMLLAGFLISDINRARDYKSEVDRVSEAGETILKKYES